MPTPSQAETAEAEATLKALLADTRKPSGWNASNWRQNPGLSTNAAPHIEAAMERHGLKSDFFNAKTPQMAIKSETPEHRQVILLKANGLSNAQIAQFTGFTKPYVSTILRQPWARALLAEAMRDAVDETYQKVLANEVLPSITVLAEIRDDENAPASARAAAADKILDRALGRPAQTIKTQELPAVKAAEDAKTESDRLERERIALEARLVSIRGKTLSSTN